MQVALLNGITMGGGAGVSIPGTFRVATEKTVCIKIALTFILPPPPPYLSLVLMIVSILVLTDSFFYARIFFNYFAPLHQTNYCYYYCCYKTIISVP